MGAARCHGIRCGVKPIASRTKESPLPTMQFFEVEKVEKDGATYSPVGCSYLPVAGVSRVTETDILDEGYKCSW